MDNEASHDERLRSHVHPPDWPAPVPAERYDLVVLGGGTAGLVAAMGSVGLGARVALVEKHLLGGDCLNFGCVPSKSLIASAHAGVDFDSAMERMRKQRADIAPHDSAARLRDAGVDVFLGEGRFTGSDTISVGDLELRFKRCCIATGARARIPPIEGLDDVRWVDNVGLFDLDALPERLLVVGGGPIGCEMAQTFRRFGSAVTLVEHGPRLMPNEDEDTSRLIESVFASEGIHVETNVSVERFQAPNIAQLSEGDSSSFDVCLLSTGRTPNTDLDLDRAGVRTTENGSIEVDSTLRTANARVYASGDCSSRFHFTHAADAMSRIVIRNAFFAPLGIGRSHLEDLVIPWATYTIPEVAGVGVREGTLIEAHFADNDRSILEGEPHGWARVWVGDDGRIHGASVVGRHAGEVLAPITLAMTSGAGMKGLAESIAPYPNRGDIVKRLGDSWSRTRLTPTTSKLLAALIRWTT